MPNMSSVIEQDNHHKPTKNVNVTSKIQPAAHSVVKKIVYKAVVSQITNSYTYYGSSENLKFCYKNHTKAFRHQYYKSDT